jgi:uncharacterized protein
MSDGQGMAVSARTRVRRVPQRAIYDRATIEAILDEAIVGHLGLVEDGCPIVTPTLVARVGAAVYVHGSAASRTLGALRGGVPACLTVTLVDGLVLARSAFHHSVNYRSVVLYADAESIEEREEKLVALKAFTNKLVAGRWDDVRQPSVQELKATTVLRLPLTDASAKARSGPPEDEEGDYALDAWAGVLPMRLERLAPKPDPLLRPGIEQPAYLAPPRS